MVQWEYFARLVREAEVMPRRTNDFQKLVVLIQKALAPRAARVTESAMVQAPGLEGFREIDVLMEGDFGPYRIKVAVEARDLKRPLALPGYESIESKYYGKTGVPVDRVVIVTRNGFTTDVRRAAEIRGMSLLTLKEAKQYNWAKHGPMQMRFSRAPHICGVTFLPPVHLRPDEIMQAHLFCPHGHDLGHVRCYIEHVVAHRVLVDRPSLIQEIHERAKKEPNGHAVANISWEMPGFRIVSRDRSQEVHQIAFRVHVVDAVGESRCTAYTLRSPQGDEHIIQHIKGTAGGTTMEVLFPNGMHSEKIMLSISSGGDSEDGIRS